MNSRGRITKLEAGRGPRCEDLRRRGLGLTRILREQTRYGPPYEFTEADRCPDCGVLGCGVLVVELVVVRRGPGGTLVDDHGNEVTGGESKRS